MEIEGDKSIKSDQERLQQLTQVEDRRVHLVLYFLEGHRVKDNDVTLIKKLEKLTSVLPIIGKGDSFDPKELHQHKLEITQQALQREIEFLDCHSAVRNLCSMGKECEECGRLCELLLNDRRGETTGPVPPFSIINANSKVLVRLGEQG